MKPTLILLPLSTALLTGLACAKREPPAPPLATAQVRLATGAPAGGSGWIAATLTAVRRATLATRLGATVEAVPVQEGQRVAAGALLVRLADGDLQGGLQAARAALAAAQAHHQRIQALVKLQAATPSEGEAAASQLAQAQAGLATVQANLAYSRIRAPFAGVIQRRLVNPGALVGPGQPLLELEGQGELELVADLSAAEAQGLKAGQKVPFEAGGRQGSAVITALATGGDPISHRGALRARVLGDGAWRTGTFARLQVPAGTGGAPEGTAAGLTVPASALVTRGELTGVFVAREGKAELHWLALGDPRGGRVPVRAGLTAADAVIDQPGALVDGQPVEVAR